MPIANCLVASEVLQMPETSLTDLTEAWEKEAGVVNVQKEMTVNFIVSTVQHGKPYSVMAWLYLPSLWSALDVNKLQVGLAKSLSAKLRVPIDGVLVITTIVDSGMVVEQGSKVSW